MAHPSKGTAWAFLAVSDQGQADTLRDQESWARQVAREHGWTIDRTVSGVSSGKLGARNLTIQMVEDLERLPADERPERILMIRLERLGRGNGLEAIEVFSRIRNLGIIIHTRLDGDVSYDRASHLLMPVLRFFIGGMENEVRRDKLNAMYGRRRSAQQGDASVAIGNARPYGLQIIDGRYVAIPSEDAAVRLAYEMRAQGYTSAAIAERLLQVAAPMRVKDEYRPQRWTAERVRRLLIKVAYRGTIVDDALWLRAQPSKQEIRRPTIRYGHALAGALRCECGAALVGVRGPSDHSKFRYYQCRNLFAHPHRIHHRNTSIDAQFAQLLGRLEADDSLLSRYLSTQDASVSDTEMLVKQRTELCNEVTALEARRRRIYEAYEDGALKRSDLQWRLEDLHQVQERLESSIKAIADDIAYARERRFTKTHVRTLVKDAAQAWSSAMVEDRRALAKAISAAFAGLTVSVDGVLHVGPYNNPDPDLRREKNVA